MCVYFFLIIPKTKESFLIKNLENYASRIMSHLYQHDDSYSIISET